MPKREHRNYKEIIMDMQVRFYKGIMPTIEERQAICKFFKGLRYNWYAEGTSLEDDVTKRVFDITFQRRL